MLNVRLNKDDEEKLNSYSIDNELSKSSIVKEALAMYFKKGTQYTPYELGADLFGAANSGLADASTTYKSRIKQKLNEKHTH